MKAGKIQREMKEIGGTPFGLFPLHLPPKRVKWKSHIQFEVMIMLLAVLAGTPVDTSMGMAFIESRGHHAVGFPVSRTPEEQSRLQVVHPQRLRIEVDRILQEVVTRGIRKVFVYCNSIAAAVDLEELAKHHALDLVSPLTVYRTLSLRHRRLGVLAANNQSTYGIERAIQEQNPATQVVGLGVLALVDAVESGLPPETIVEDFHLESLLAFFHGLGCDGLVLGCTHFSYLHGVLHALAPFPVIDPGEDMLRHLMDPQIFPEEGDSGTPL